MAKGLRIIRNQEIIFQNYSSWQACLAEEVKKVANYIILTNNAVCECTPSYLKWLF